MSVVSVKVPPEIKKEMENLRASVEWPKEIRQFIVDRVELEKRKQNASRAEQILREVRRLPKGSAARLVRGDRDHHS